MALHGNAFLALWNDIAPHREREYDRWHSQEHVPERVAVTGFRGARRFVNRAAARHRYFTLYEVADLATFEHAEYLFGFEPVFLLQVLPSRLRGLILRLPDSGLR